MSKITAVEPQKTLRRSLPRAESRDSGRRFNIFLDGTFAFGADEDLVVEYRLIPGKILTTSDVEQLLFASEVGKLMGRIYRLFSIRQRFEKEVRDYLKNLSFKRKVKGNEEISGLVIDSVIEKLKKKRMLNDLEFAKAWVDARGKKYGPQRIRQELYQKGIDREIIDEIISNNKLMIDEEEVVRHALEKKLKVWKSLDKMIFRKKAIGFLLRRGFEYSVVKDVVENILKKR